MPNELNEGEKKRLQAAREEKIKDQAKLAIQTIQANPNILQTEIETLSIKAEALELALVIMKSDPQKFTAQQIKEATYAWDTKRIKRQPKIDRALTKLTDTGIGGTNTKSLFTKLPKSPEDKNLLKHHKTVLLKEADSNSSKEAEQICEYLVMNLAGTRGSQFYPKGRLYKNNETGQTQLSSTFLENFITIQQYLDEQKVTQIEAGVSTPFTKEAKGLGRIFADSVLFADPDSKADNVGITTLPDGSKHWTRIDYGLGLYYGTKKMSSAKSHKEHLCKSYPHVYEENMFKGTEFAYELNQATQDFDEDRYKNIIRTSLKNLREARGDGYLENQETQDTLKARFGIAEDITITEALIEETIISNTKRLNAELQEMSRAVALEAIKDAIKTNDHKSIDFLNKNMPDSLIDFIKDAIKKEDLQSLKSLQNFKLTPSLLKYSLDNGNPDLAAKMFKAKFKLHESEIDKNAETAILKSNNFIRRGFGKLTQNDHLRLAIIASTSEGDKREAIALLASKPSPLFLAIKTNQANLVREMSAQGFTLKRSELHEYTQSLPGLKDKEILNTSKDIRRRLLEKESLDTVTSSTSSRPSSRSISF